MGYFGDEVLRAAAVVGAIIRELAVDESNTIRQVVHQRFTRGDHRRKIWQDIVNEVSIQDSNAWKWLDEFVGATAVILFFDEDEEKTMFEIGNGSQVVAILGESFAFEFYLTNYVTDYLMCFNHHDFLITAGTAAKWLSSRSQA